MYRLSLEPRLSLSLYIGLLLGRRLGRNCLSRKHVTTYLVVHVWPTVGDAWPCTCCSPAAAAIGGLLARIA